MMTSSTSTSKNSRASRKTSSIGHGHGSHSGTSAGSSGSSSGHSKPSEAARKKQDIEEQPWFHGYRTRADIESILVNPGDWVVRATEGRTNATELVISLLSKDKTVKNLTLKYDGTTGKWELGVLAGTKKYKGFFTVYDLVTYYKARGLPGNHQMKHAITRDKYYVRHSSIKYDPVRDFLGNGNFCDVYKAKFERSPGSFIDVAVKVCRSDPNETPQTAKETREAMQALVREGNIMQHYDHENVIQFYGIVYDQKPVMIIMEYACGSLDIHLKKQKENIEAGERIIFCYEAANGMHYLHRQHCIHRDLAARNCLISHLGTIKIADFGLSDIHNVTEKQATQQQVPLRWMAPESLVKNPVYSRKSDVWSYGVLMYEIFNMGEKPWPEEEPKKIATMIRRCQMPELPSTMPPEVQAVTKGIWIKPAEARPEFAKIVEDLQSLLLTKYPPPAAEKCSVNQLTGVKRCSFTYKVQVPAFKHPLVDLNRTETETRTKESGPEEADTGITNENTVKPVVPVLFDPPSLETAVAACQEDYVQSAPAVVSVCSVAPSTAPSVSKSTSPVNPDAKKRPIKSSGNSTSRKRNIPQPRQRTLKE